MSEVCVIEINDAGLAAANASGLLGMSPGYAVMDGSTLRVGAAAFASARLNPRRSYDRFWSQLDQQPLGRPAGDAKTHADLAYFHLRDLWQSLDSGIEEVVFAVPADFGTERLALLLGIAQALEMPVTGLVATAVAAAAAVTGDAPRLYLDAELHRLTATRVSGGEALSLGANRELAKLGIAGLYDAWANMIAERFVRETRYDPLHQAEAEQKLYEHLPGWLESLHSQSHARFELQAGTRTHHVDITIDELQQAAARVYQPIADAAAQAHAAVVILGHRLASLPGLAAALRTRDSGPVVAQTQTTIAESVLEHIQSIRSDAGAPAFVTRLPGAISSAVTPPDARRPASAKLLPSHLLHQWQAYPINGAPLVLDAGSPRGLGLGETTQGAVVSLRAGSAVLEPGQATVRINGEKAIKASELSVGDAVTVDGGAEMHLIALVPGNAAP